jgi:solute carrier family 13 (sodium-dependent dicarboxylate transporter), member 2/3/5
LSDAGIAIIAAVILFVLPVDWRNGVFALDWKTVLNLPWGVLILFGGGLSLASAVVETGVDEWIGSLISGLTVLPTLLLVIVKVEPEHGSWLAKEIVTSGPLRVKR